MRYNPCGRYCEMMRRPYEIPCRFLRDSAIDSTLRWVEAREDALPLDRTSIIESEDWSNDRGMWPDRIGEQDGYRVFRAAAAPVGSGQGHVCGTDEDFAQGGLYEPDLPPVRYDALGWPVCCAGARRLRGGGGGGGRSAVSVHRRVNYGGAGASGRSAVSVRQPIHVYGGAGASGRSPLSPVVPIRVYGGAGASGRSAVSVRQPIHVYGGAGASGRSEFAVSPVCPALGPTCDLAVHDDLDHWCWFELATKVDRWRKYNTEPGGTYLFELYVVQNGGRVWDLYSGDSCPGKTLIAAGDFQPHYRAVEFTAVGTVAWWRLGAQVGPGVTDGATRLTRLT